MPGLQLFKKGFYSHIGANKPIVAGTINLGSTKGRGSSTRMFNYCKTHSPNPSECINQFITVKTGNSGVPPTPPTPPTPKFEVLGDGLNSDVYSIILNGTTNLYISGAFTTNNSGTVTFNQLASWNIDGKTWSIVSNNGGGVGVVGGNGYSYIITPNSRLYVGGSFYGAQSSTYLQSIGIYNLISTEWFSLNSTGSGAGVIYYNGSIYSNGIVYSIVYNLKNNYVYFGGTFNQTALGQSLNYIASTDSTAPASNPSVQYPLGQYPPINQLVDGVDIGLNGLVNQLSVDNNPSSAYYGDVYVCGNFTGNTSGSKAFKYVAVFNPTPSSSTNGSFFGLGFGVNVANGPPDPVVNGYAKSIMVNPYLPSDINDIYIGGYFSNAQGSNNVVGCSNIVKFNRNLSYYYYLGSTPGDGVNGIVNTILCLSNGDVYVGGSFTSAIYGGVSVPGTSYIARWRSSNSTWNALPITLNGDVYTITEELDSEIYINGAYTLVNSTPANRIVKYIP